MVVGFTVPHRQAHGENVAPPAHAHTSQPPLHPQRTDTLPAASSSTN